MIGINAPSLLAQSSMARRISYTDFAGPFTVGTSPSVPVLCKPSHFQLPPIPDLPNRDQTWPTQSYQTLLTQFFVLSVDRYRNRESPVVCNGLYIG